MCQAYGESIEVVCHKCGKSYREGQRHICSARPAAQEVEPSAPAAEGTLEGWKKIARMREQQRDTLVEQVKILEKRAASGQAGAGPRCPKCGGNVTLGRPHSYDQPDVIFRVECSKCLPMWWGIRNWEHLQEFFPVSAPASQPSAQLEKLRNDGWMVAVHNDYWIGSPKQRKTFWLLTRSGREGAFVKGEGDTDAEAIAQITRQLESHGEALSAPKAPAPLDLENAAKEIDELADKWFHANPEFSRSVRAILARHLGSGEASKCSTI